LPSLESSYDLLDKVPESGFTRAHSVSSVILAAQSHSYRQEIIGIEILPDFSGDEKLFPTERFYHKSGARQQNDVCTLSAGIAG
jgi:hypothetical protein